MKFQSFGRVYQKTVCVAKGKCIIEIFRIFVQFRPFRIVRQFSQFVVEFSELSEYSANSAFPEVELSEYSDDFIKKTSVRGRTNVYCQNMEQIKTVVHAACRDIFTASRAAGAVSQ